MSQITPSKIARYDAPHQFEPLLPSPLAFEPVLERASDLTRAAAALGSAAMPGARDSLRTLLRGMNSYYTNRIEGEHTRPADIERALLQDFSSQPDIARRQRLAVAHIRTEQYCEQQIDASRSHTDVARDLHSPRALEWLHHELFRQCEPEDLRLADGSSMQPGALRTRGVAVGRHEAPVASALPLFLARWSQVYAGVRRGEAAIVAAAASHHRLAWMHPFLDGNGRVARLHTHLLLHTMGLTHGLWSPLRGYARSEDRYRALLQAADEPRRGDLDGRGNLSQAALVDWIGYTLDVCIDQVRFMASMLDISTLKSRIAAALTFEEQTLRSGVRIEALRPLHYLFTAEAELSRADFKAMTMLGERIATETVSALCREGFLHTDSAYGALRFAIPPRALRFYFPALWPEAEQDAELSAAERRSRSPARAAPRPRRPGPAR